jgi:hypothetical protein
MLSTTMCTTRAFIGVSGGIRNLSSELLEVTTRNWNLLLFWRDEHPGHSISYKIRCAIERLEESLMRLTEVALVAECRFVDSSGGVR